MVKIKNEKNVNWFNQILSEVFVHVKRTSYLQVFSNLFTICDRSFGKVWSDKRWPPGCKEDMIPFHKGGQDVSNSRRRYDLRTDMLVIR